MTYKHTKSNTTNKHYKGKHNNTSTVIVQRIMMTKISAKELGTAGAINI
jgi:hypothetical protein